MSNKVELTELQTAMFAQIQHVQLGLRNLISLYEKAEEEDEAAIQAFDASWPSQLPSLGEMQRFMHHFQADFVNISLLNAQDKTKGA